MTTDHIALRQVAQAIAATCRQADPSLEVYHYLAPSPGVPAAMVTMELDFMDVHSMDRMEFQLWRVWVIVQLGDPDEAALQLLDYVDDGGATSIRAAFRAPDAAWRAVTGLSEISYFGFGRMPTSVQTPGWVSFGGPEFWGVSLIFRVRYGEGA